MEHTSATVDLGTWIRDHKVTWELDPWVEMVGRRPSGHPRFSWLFTSSTARAIYVRWTSARGSARRRSGATLFGSASRPGVGRTDAVGSGEEQCR
jgi:hypothetical protein